MDEDSLKAADELAKLLFPRQATPEQVKSCFEAVGYGLSAWQLVEKELYLLFERCLSPMRPGAAGCAFHTLQFHGKLGATDAAVRFALLSVKEQSRTKLISAWDDIIEKARKTSQARNAMAHFQTMSYVDEPKTDRRVKLLPPTHDYRYAAGIVHKREYTINDLKVHAQGFLALAKRISTFRSKVPLAKRRRSSKKRPPASP